MRRNHYEEKNKTPVGKIAGIGNGAIPVRDYAGTTVRGDSLEGLISIESPLGKAILGHKAGDRVEVVVNSNISYWIEILSIENTDDSGDKIMSF